MWFAISDSVESDDASGTPITPLRAKPAGLLGFVGKHAGVFAMPVITSRQPSLSAMSSQAHSPLPHRAVSVLSDLGMAAILALFARTLLPSGRKGPDLATGEAAHPALGVDPFLEPVGREAAQLPKAGGVGNERPYRSRRLGEITFLAVAVDCRHSIASRRWLEFGSAN